jgi:hypothetical protein
MMQYSGKENENIGETVGRNIQALIDLIRSKYLSTDSENEPLDFGWKVQYFTLDVVSDAVYREAFGFLATDLDLYDYMKIVESIFVAAAMVTIFPALNWVLSLSIMRAGLPSGKDPLRIGKSRGRLEGFLPAFRYLLLIPSKYHKKSCFGPNKKLEKDMLGSFIAQGLNQEDAESEIVVQM